MITAINESKTLIKHISYEFKCKFDGKKHNSDQWWNINKCRCECKKRMYVKKIIFGIVLHVVVKMEKYLASVMDDSAIAHDEIIESYDEEAKTFPTNFNVKKVECKTQNFYILLAFLLITLELLIDVSIYCYLIKHQAKQKHLLPFHFTNNELKEVMY